VVCGGGGLYRNFLFKGHVKVLECTTQWNLKIVGEFWSKHLQKRCQDELFYQVPHAQTVVYKLSVFHLEGISTSQVLY